MPLTSKFQERSAKYQMKSGNEFIQAILPRPGDHILDFGCGTGELTAVLADLVGPTGKVLGVDPDKERIRLARATYGSQSNLKFAVGNCFCFPGEGEEKYDLVFSNDVLHWIPNKLDLFAKFFSSLKKGGRVAMQYLPPKPKTMKKLLEKLDLRNEALKISMINFEDNGVIENYLRHAGFEAMRMSSTDNRLYYDSIYEYCDVVEASVNGLISFGSVSKERLEEAEPLFMEKGKFVDDVVYASFLAVKE